MLAFLSQYDMGSVSSTSENSKEKSEDYVAERVSSAIIAVAKKSPTISNTLVKASMPDHVYEGEDYKVYLKQYQGTH